MKNKGMRFAIVLAFLFSSILLLSSASMASTVSGRILDALGDPVAGLVVTLFNSKTGATMTTCPATDADGNFTCTYTSGRRSAVAQVADPLGRGYVTGWYYDRIQFTTDATLAISDDNATLIPVGADNATVLANWSIFDKPLFGAFSGVGSDSGTYFYNKNEWTSPITGAIPNLAVTISNSDCNSTLVASFPGVSPLETGIWATQDPSNGASANWVKLTNVAAQDLLYDSTTKQLWADLGDWGLYQLAAKDKYFRSGVAADGNWTALSLLNPKIIKAGSGKLFASFGKLGLYMWNPLGDSGDGNWTELNAADVRRMQFTTTASGFATWNNKLFVDFGDYWGNYTFDPTVAVPANGWDRIQSYPEQLVSTGTALYGDFGALGLWGTEDTVNVKAWALINKANPDKMYFKAATGAKLFVDFGALGLWAADAGDLNGLLWYQINQANPDVMWGIEGNSLYVDFGVWGLYKWDGVAWAWREISNLNPDFTHVSGVLFK